MEPLTWVKEGDYHWEAQLGTRADGARFTLGYFPTCYRRGPWRLLVETCSGANHHAWGCFDDQDQPLRNYHDPHVAIDEANRIAVVLWADRYEIKGADRKALAARVFAGPRPGLPNVPETWSTRADVIEREAAWVVTMYDQANTGRAVENLGSRGVLLNGAMEDLRAAIGGNAAAIIAHVRKQYEEKQR